MFANTPCHVQEKYHRQTLYWCSSDSKDRYQKNLQDEKSRRLLEGNGWVDSTITYEFNRYGFRSRDPDPTSPGILALGCSYTVGIGLPWDNVWPTYVSRELDIPVDNLGVLGASNGLMFRLAHYWIPQLKPRVVVWQKTFEHRFELLDQHDESNVLSPANTTISGKELFASWWYNDLNSQTDALRNELAIRYTCETNGIPIIKIEVEDFRNPQLGLSRDLDHSGPQNQQTVAWRLVDEIKNLGI